MALIRWTDSLSVQVAQLDQQHQILINLINELNDAMRQGKGQQVMDPILDRLVAYAGSHFATEERYFIQYAYPAAGEHRRAHAEFADRVADFKERLMQTRIGLSIEVMNFLSDWLQHHIQGEDKKYSACFNAAGLK